MEVRFVPNVSGIVIAVMDIFAYKSTFKKKKSQEPPANPVHHAASTVVQETFEESVSRVAHAASGESPAEDLAALGDARKRR